MRPIINSTVVTLDGVVNYMDKWRFALVDEEPDSIALDQLRKAGSLLMGRHTYDACADASPGREDDYPNRIISMPKYVVSSRLTDPAWENTMVISGDLIDTVAGAGLLGEGPDWDRRLMRQTLR